MTEDDWLEPSIDPRTERIYVRNVKARSEADDRTVMTVRGHQLVSDEPETNTGPTPLELVLAGLAGCENVMIHRCAKAMGFAYTGVDMDAESEIDQRGSRGVRGVRPYFSKVRLAIRVQTNESEERFRKLVKNVESRCPVYNLFLAADVEVDVDWRKEPAA